MRRLLTAIVILFVPVFLSAQCVPTVTGPPATFSPPLNSFLPDAQSSFAYTGSFELTLPDTVYTSSGPIIVDSIMLSSFSISGSSGMPTNPTQPTFISSSSSFELPGTAVCIEFSTPFVGTTLVIDTLHTDMGYEFFGRDTSGGNYVTNGGSVPGSAIQTERDRGNYFFRIIPSPPNADFDVYGLNSHGVLCEGLGTGVGAVSNAVSNTFAWTFQGGSPATGTGAVVNNVTFPGPGSYDITLEATNQFGTNTLTKTVEVVGFPSKFITVTGAGPSNCGLAGGGSAVMSYNGTSANLQADNSHPGATYDWNGPGVTGNTNDNVNINQDGEYWVLIDNSGCVAVTDAIELSASHSFSAELCMVSVDSATEKNIITWEKGGASGLDSVKIYKEGNQFGVFDLIHSQSYADFSTYIDMASHPEVHADRYAIVLVDSCNRTSTISLEHRTMHLSVYEGVAGNINLSWNHYEGAVFPSYNIYSGSNAMAMSLLETVNSGINTYTDLNPPPGLVYYQIEVVGIACSPSKRAGGSSWSNVAVDQVIPVGIDEVSNSRVRIYPNPASGSFQLFMDHTEAQLMIYALDGKLLRTEQLISGLNTIDRKLLASGVYMAEIRADQATISRQKLVIY